MIVSDIVPMADYVELNRCGSRIGSMAHEAIIKAVKYTAAHYHELRINAVSVGRRDFTTADMVASYRRLYEAILKKPCVAPPPNALRTR